MRFLRWGRPGAERPALLDGTGTPYDLSALTPDIDGAFLAGGGPQRARRALAAGQLPPLDLTGERIGPPVARPGAVVCVGLNYRAHAAESGMAVPAEPVVFLKAANTVIGPADQVLVPRGSAKTDYEVELAVVIGQPARYLPSPAAAAEVIAGYAVSNDVSEREFQLERGGQWDKGKSCETFNPLGPWLVTADEVVDPGDLRLRLWVNGEARQDGSTGDMIFDVHHLVWYLSQFMVLEPGDVVNTGTPAGVALGANGFGYLSPGDVVELEIDGPGLATPAGGGPAGLGRQRQVIGQA